MAAMITKFIESQLLKEVVVEVEDVDGDVVHAKFRVSSILSIKVKVFPLKMIEVEVVVLKIQASSTIEIVARVCLKVKSLSKEKYMNNLQVQLKKFKKTKSSKKNKQKMSNRCLVKLLK